MRSVTPSMPASAFGSVSRSAGTSYKSSSAEDQSATKIQSLWKGHSARSKLSVPGKSGRGSSRSGSRRGSVSRDYLSKMKSGRSKSGICSRSGFTKSGIMVQIDEAELNALRSRVKAAEARAEALHLVSVREVLQFVIKNSNTAQVTIGDQVCPPGY